MVSTRDVSEVKLTRLRCCEVGGRSSDEMTLQRVCLGHWRFKGDLCGPW